MHPNTQNDIHHDSFSKNLTDNNKNKNNLKVKNNWNFRIKLFKNVLLYIHLIIWVYTDTGRYIIDQYKRLEGVKIRKS